MIDYSKHLKESKHGAYRPQKNIRLIRDGEKGGGCMEVGKREITYLPLHCHHQNDFCVQMGSDESHFNVSLTVKDIVTRQCPQTTTFVEEGEPKRIRTEVTAYQPNALPLG